MKDQKTPLLAVDRINYRAGGKQILSDLSLTLQAGEFTLITGPSGCGKSTLLKIISSLISPQSGEISLAGKNILQYPPEEYRQQVSYCAQTPSLFGDTVADNLLFPWTLRRKTADKQQLIKELQRFSLPEKILDQPVTELSGGEKQRISLIRHLQFLPQVLLLDEITSALDEQNKRQVNDIIHHFVRENNLAVLWVTHDVDEIRHADNVIRLTSSSAQQEGAPSEKTKEDASEPA